MKRTKIHLFRFQRLRKETNDPKDKKHLNRDAKNSINRRVVIYFYQPGTIVEAPAWPCPAAPRTEGEAASAKTACTKRFWKDSKDRIKPLKEPAESHLPSVFVEPSAAPQPEGTEPPVRVTPQTLPVLSRAKNFAEVEQTLSVAAAACEARRCLRCDLTFTRRTERSQECRASEERAG